jgi:transcription factor E
MELSQLEIDNLVEEVSGREAVLVAQFIINAGENVSEFLIAEKLETGINHIRNLLYKLQENNLVTFMRKKDKKKGWYIYYWTFNKVQANILINKLKEKRIITLKKRLEKEAEDFLSCNRKCLRITFSNAMENNFKCPDCESILKQIDNKKQVASIKKELELLTKSTLEATV